MLLSLYHANRAGCEQTRMETMFVGTSDVRDVFLKPGSRSAYEEHG